MKKLLSIALSLFITINSTLPINIWAETTDETVDIPETDTTNEIVEESSEEDDILDSGEVVVEDESDDEDLVIDSNEDEDIVIDDSQDDTEIIIEDDEDDEATEDVDIIIDEQTDDVVDETIEDEIIEEVEETPEMVGLTAAPQMEEALGEDNNDYKFVLTYGDNPIQPKFADLAEFGVNDGANSSDKNVVEASTSKLVDYVKITPINVGEAIIYISSNNANIFNLKRSTKEYKVKVNPADLKSISLNNNSFTYNGDNQFSTVTVKGVEKNDASLVENTDYSLEYFKYNSENSVYETIEKTSIINAGNYKVVATGINNYTSTLEKEFTINKSSDFTITSSDVAFTGSEVDPSIEVKGIKGETIDSSEYTIGGTNPTATEAATYSATVVMNDDATNYTGSKDFEWKITNVKTAISSVNVTNPTYNGDPQLPTFEVIDANGKKVNTDGYEVINLVEQTNHSEDGYSFVVKGKGAFITEEEGITVNWNVNKVKLTKPTLESNSFEYTGTTHEPTINGFDPDTMNKSGTFSDEGSSDTNTTNTITISLKNNNNYEWEDGSITAVALSWTISKITLKNTFYLEIDQSTDKLYWSNERSQSASLSDVVPLDNTIVEISIEKGIHSYYTIKGLKEGTTIVNASSTKETIHYKVVVSRKQLKVPTVNETLTYTGSAQTATFNNYDSSKITASNITQTDANTYTATFSINDKNTYKWSDGTDTNKTVNWTINKANINVTSDAKTFVAIADGSVHIPTITVTGVTTMVEGTDYKITYKNNNDITIDKSNIREAGEYKATVEGIGNYQGSETINWEISDEAIEIESSDVTVTNPTYNGTSQSPDVVVTVKGKTLVKDTDYTLDVTNQSDYKVGGYSLTIKGKGNYTTSDPDNGLSINWNVNQLDIANTTITQNITSLTYDGNEHTFDVTVKVGEHTIDSSNYDLTGDVEETDANDNYSVILTPKANLTGSAKSYTWKITKAQIPQSIISSIRSTGNHTYDGNPYTLITHDTLPEGCTFYSGIGEREIHVMSEDDNKPQTYEVGEVSATYVNLYPNTTTETYYPVYWYIDGGKNYTSKISSSNPGKIETTIKKADPAVLTANNQTYTGESITLVTGESPANTYVYYVSTKKITITDIIAGKIQLQDDAPTKIEANKYYVYYIGNSVNKNHNFNDGNLTDVKEIEVTIARKSVGNKPTNINETYTGEEINNGYIKPEGVTLTGTTAGTKVGTYTATYTPDSNHCWEDGSTDAVQVILTISKASQPAESYTAPVLKESDIYTGNSINLLSSAGSATYGTIQYYVSTLSNDEDNFVGSASATVTNAGTYYVYYKVVGDDNHSDTEPLELGSVLINKATSALTTTPSAITNLVYDGQPKALVSAGVSTTGSSVKYKLGNGEYNSDVPTATNAGTYYVYYKVVGDDNHTSIDEFEPIEVTIAKASVACPSAGEYTYNYNEQGFDIPSEVELASGNETKQTAAGTYSSVLKLKDTDNYEWSTGDVDNKTINWSIAKAVIDTVTLNQTSFDVTGEIIKPTITAVKAGDLVVKNEDYTTSLEGKKEIGDYSFNITSKNSSIDDSSIGDIKWSIVSKGIGSGVVTITSSDFVYDGNEKEVTFTVTLDGKQLSAGTDYTIVDDSNKATDAGTHTLSLAGAGNYSGTLSKEWTIAKKEVGITWSNLTVEYTGLELKPTATPSEELELNVVLDKTTINVGTYTATASFANVQKNYVLKGTDTTKTFEITRKQISVPTAKTLTYNRLDQTGVETGEGYTLTGNTGNAAGNYKAIATLGSNYKWSDGTGTKEINWSISPAAITAVTLDKSSFDYDSKSHLPNITEVKAGDLTLDTEEYIVSNDTAQTAIGDDYKITVTGKGNFTGSKDVTWTIDDKKDLSVATISYIGGTKTYNGLPITVTSNDFKLIYNGSQVNSSEYIVSVNDTKTNAGTYTATISTADGKGWNNSINCNWTIDPRNISNASLEKNSYEYTGSDIYPVVKDGTTTLVLGTDFTANWPVDLKNATSTGFPNKATLIGQGNYTGTKEISWNITKLEITVPSAKTNLTYNKEEQTGVEFSDTYIELVSGSVAATNAGSYSAVFALKDKTNYKWKNDGTENKTVNWKIEKAIPTVSPISDLIYTGEDQPLLTRDSEAEITYHIADVSLGTAITDILEDGYKTTIPKRTDAGNYTIFWYITDTTNYKDPKSPLQGKLNANTFNVSIAKANLVSAAIVETQKVYKYDGNSHVPTDINVTGVEKDGILTNDKYTLSYYRVTESGDELISDTSKGCVNVGTYKVVATAKIIGNYTGSVSDTWTIEKADIPAPVKIDNLVYENKDLDLVKFDENINYSFFVSNEKINNLEDLNKKEFVSTAKAKNKGTYYVYWKATGNDNYKEASVSIDNYVEVSITAPVIDSVTVSDKGIYKYNGNPIVPSITVKAGNTTLTSDNYQIQKSDGTVVTTENSALEVGEYTYKVVGINNASGSVDFTFKIIPNISVEVETTDENDYRKVVYSVDLDAMTINFKVTPKKVNTYVEAVTINKKTTLLTASANNEVQLTYDNNGVASGSYSIEGVSIGEYTIVPTIEELTQKTNPSLVYIDNTLTPISNARIIDAIINEETDNNELDVKYYIYAPTTYSNVTKNVEINWKDIDYTPSSAIDTSHSFGQPIHIGEYDLSPRELEYVRVTGTNKYAKVSFYTELDLEDDRIPTKLVSSYNLITPINITATDIVTYGSLKAAIMDKVSLLTDNTEAEDIKQKYDSYLNDIELTKNGNSYEFDASVPEKSDSITIKYKGIYDTDKGLKYKNCELAISYKYSRFTTTVNPTEGGSFDSISVNNNNVKFLVAANDDYFIDSFLFGGTEVDSNDVTWEFKKGIKIFSWPVSKDARTAYFNYSYDDTDTAQHEVIANLKKGFVEKEVCKLAYIDGLDLYEDLNKAVFDAVTETNIEYIYTTADEFAKLFKVEYDAGGINGGDGDTYELLSFTPGQIYVNKHKFGHVAANSEGKQIEKIRISYIGSDQKYIGLVLNTSLEIVDDRISTKFIVPEKTIEIKADHIDTNSTSKKYDDIYDVVVQNVQLIEEKNNTSIYEIFEDNGIDIKELTDETVRKYLSVYDSEGNEITSVLDLPRETETTITAKFKGIYDTEKNLKYKDCVSDPIKVKYTRYKTQMNFNVSDLTHEVEIIYDAEGNNLKNAIYNKDFIVVYSLDELNAMSVLDYDLESEISYTPEIPEASILNAHDITVSYAGDDLHQPCQNIVKVRVWYAPSEVIIDVDNKTFDGKKIDVNVTTDPVGLNTAYMIAGLEGDAEGYVSLHIDTSDMIYSVKSSQTGVEFIDKIIDEFNKRAVEAALKNTIFSKYYDEPTGILRYGDAFVEIINDALSGNEGNVESVKQAAQIFIDIAKELNMEQYVGDITKLLELLDKIDEYRTEYNVKGVNFRINDTPRDAGLYVIGAITVQKNYVPDIDVKLFTILPKELDATWDQELPSNNVITLTREGKVEFDFGADTSYDTLKDEAAITEKNPEGFIKNETSYKTFYLGIKDPMTLADVDISDGKLLEHIQEIIKKNTGIDFSEPNIVDQVISAINNNTGSIYISNSPGTEPGAYVEIAAFYGNYEKILTRAYLISKIDTKILLDDITLTYQGKVETKQAISDLLNTDSNNVVVEATTEQETVKDSEGKVVRPDLFFIGVEDSGKFAPATKEIPVNAGKYLMFARYTGSAAYKPSNIFEDEAKDIIEVMKTINASNFEEKIEELGLPILTINKQKVSVSWNEELASKDFGGKLNDLGVLVYDYIGQNNMPNVKDYVSVVPQYPSFNSESEDVELTYLTPSTKNANQSQLANHQLTFILTGDDAKNYYLNDISFIEANIGVLYYHINPAQITINWMKDPQVGYDVDGKPVKGSVDKDNLVYEYCKDENGDNIEPSDYVAVSERFEGDDAKVHFHYVLDEILGKTDVGNHTLKVYLEGEDARNYNIVGSVIEETIDKKILTYKVTPVHVTINWMKDPQVGYDVDGKPVYGKTTGDNLTYQYCKDANGDNISVRSFVEVSKTFPKDNLEYHYHYVGENHTDVTLTPHILQVYLEDKPGNHNSNNYIIDGSIVEELIAKKVLTYEVTSAPLQIRWATNKPVGKNYFGFDVYPYINISRDFMKFQYVGQDFDATDFVDVQGVFDKDTVTMHYILDELLAMPDAGNHVLIADARGKDSRNYSIVGSVIEDTIEKKFLRFEITKAPLMINWMKDPVVGKDYLGEDVKAETNWFRNDMKLQYVGQDFYAPDYVSVLGILPGDHVYMHYALDEILAGPNVGKHSLIVDARGINSHNYSIVGSFFEDAIERRLLTYEITPAPIYVDWIEGLEGVDIDNVFTYTYNADYNFLNDKFSYVGVLPGEERLVGVIIKDGKRINTNVNEPNYAITFNAIGRFIPGTALTKRYSDNYVIMTDKLEYRIDQKVVDVTWLITEYEEDMFGRKLPTYRINGLVGRDDAKLFMNFSDLQGNPVNWFFGPYKVGTYVADVFGISNRNYKLDESVIGTLFTIVDKDSLIYDRKADILTGSISHYDLRNDGASARMNYTPDLTRNVAENILSPYDDLSAQYEAGNNMHLILEASYIDTSDISFEEYEVLSKNKLGSDIMNRAYFFDLSLYTMVNGLKHREKVVEPGYEVPVTVRLQNSLNAYNKVIGRNRIYKVARYHYDEEGNLMIDKIYSPEIKIDENGNYYFTFKSDKFSTYAIYSYNKPSTPSIPKTGVK